MSSQTYGWSDTRSIQSAVDRALTELHQMFPAYLSTASMVYAGFSQGATLAGPFLIANARRFPVAALAEGGFAYLADSRFARDYRAAGGQRILIVCGTRPCFVTANRAKRILEDAGLMAIVAGDSQSGHNLNVRMQDSLRNEWDNLVGGIPGWETFRLHRWPAPDHGILSK